MKFQQEPKVRAFLRRCEKQLLDPSSHRSIRYPLDFVGRRKWRSEELENKNEAFLKGAANKANVYAIFTKTKYGKKRSLRYIGQTVSTDAKARLRNHLFKKDERTGAKLRKVKEHVKAGGQVLVSWISIEPESLRHYVEEELIARHREADWNTHRKKTS